MLSNAVSKTEISKLPKLKKNVTLTRKYTCFALLIIKKLTNGFKKFDQNKTLQIIVIENSSIYVK